MGKQNVGMMYPVFALMVSHTDGSMPQYDTGRVIMEARSATVNYTRGNNPDYGDDRIVDDDNGITDLSISFEPTGLTDAHRVYMLGEELRPGGTGGEGSNGQWVTDGDAPWGGFGYIRCMRLNGIRMYEAWITLKIKFREETQTTQTREGSITWGHPTIVGRAAGLDVDGGDSLKYQLHETFDTIAAAKTFINGILNVSTEPI